MRTPEELADAARSARMVLVVVSGGSARLYARELAEDLASRSEEMVVVLAEEAAVGKPGPRVQLYLDGELVWEQIGLFQRLPVDREAIRAGIREVLERRGLSYRELGVRVNYY